MKLQSVIKSTTQEVKNVFKSLSDEEQLCLQNCAQARQVCEQTLAHCFETGGEHLNAQRLKLLVDAAQIAQLHADFLARGSDYHILVADVCARICRACAASCELAGKKHETLQFCAGVVRRCAESCEAMLDKN